MTATKVTSGVIASGVIPDPSGWAFVSAVTASSSATVAFTGMATGYDYMVDMANVLPATDAQSLRARLGVTGPTYRTSSYLSLSGQLSDSGGSSGTGVITTYLALINSTAGNVASEEMVGSITIRDPATATKTFTDHRSGGGNTTSGMKIVGFGSGMYNSAEAHTAIQFYMPSGNIATGFFKLYKRPNA